MSITLPTSPRAQVATPGLTTYGRPTTPIAGSRRQFLNRLGSRYRATISLPPMSYARARAWIGARARAATEGQTVVLEWPQPEQASLGAPLVNGAGQAGTTLICDGFTPGALIPDAAFFSFSLGGRHYLHMVTTAAVANGAGQASLNVAPMLRRPPADNAALDFVTPKIEGFMDTGDVEWDLTVLMHVGIQFTLEEDR